MSQRQSAAGRSGGSRRVSRRVPPPGRRRCRPRPGRPAVVGGRCRGVGTGRRAAAGRWFTAAACDCRADEASDEPSVGSAIGRRALGRCRRRRRLPIGALRSVRVRATRAGSLGADRAGRRAERAAPCWSPISYRQTAIAGVCGKNGR